MHDFSRRSLKLFTFLFLCGCTAKQPLQTLETNPTAHLSPQRSYEFAPHPLTGTYANSPAVKNFIHSMVNQHGFEESYLNDIFSQAQRLNYVIRLENAPLYQKTKPETSDKPRLRSWSRYRRKFVDEAHIERGITFWHEHAEALQQASANFSVDPEYIVAIIGVETFFGRNMGNTCTFDALTTLAFDTQRRDKFFQVELENFLLMAREEHYHPREPLGSWAGAMGFGQFMPSSFRRLAVDFNKDGHRNLWHPADAIGSVAHYFSKQGWQFQQPVAVPTADEYSPDAIALGGNQGHEYWQTYPNFNVIRHYNKSNKYVMAVHQLAQAIKNRYYQTDSQIGLLK